jgi:hypothetical protein
MGARAVISDATHVSLYVGQTCALPKQVKPAGHHYASGNEKFLIYSTGNCSGGQSAVREPPCGGAYVLQVHIKSKSVGQNPAFPLYNKIHLASLDHIQVCDNDDKTGTRLGCCIVVSNYIVVISRSLKFYVYRFIYNRRHVITTIVVAPDTTSSTLSLWDILLPITDEHPKRKTYSFSNFAIQRRHHFDKLPNWDLGNVTPGRPPEGCMRIVSDKIIRLTCRPSLPHGFRWTRLHRRCPAPEARRPSGHLRNIGMRQLAEAE